MKLDIVKEVEAPLLSRKRVTLTVESDSTTPARQDLIKKVAEKLGAKPELVVIKHIYTSFGTKSCKVIAHVYKKREELERIEEGYLVKKNTLAAPKEEAVAAE
ncbi:MAG: 30S ribosomal protein S24e [Nanoarchaeota archaeon]